MNHGSSFFGSMDMEQRLQWVPLMTDFSIWNIQAGAVLTVERHNQAMSEIRKAVEDDRSSAKRVPNRSLAALAYWKRQLEEVRNGERAQA